MNFSSFFRICSCIRCYIQQPVIIISIHPFHFFYVLWLRRGPKLKRRGKVSKRRRTISCCEHAHLHAPSGPLMFGILDCLDFTSNRHEYCTGTVFYNSQYFQEGYIFAFRFLESVALIMHFRPATSHTPPGSPSPCRTRPTNLCTRTPCP